MGWLQRLLGPEAPDVLAHALADGEHVLGVAETRGGPLAVTALGLWVPDGDGVRRIGWHLVSKAAWSGEALTVTEADEVGTAGQAVLLADRAPVPYPLERPGKIPQLVYRRVEGSIRSRYHKEFDGGGAWFVVRKVPGRDGSVLQVRPEPGVDTDTVARIAEEAAEQLSRGGDS
jgi:hypothetical protein